MKNFFGAAATALVMLAAVGCADPQSSGEQSNLVRAETIDAALQGFVDDGRVVGVSALVYRGGKEAYFGTAGFADRESRAPMTREAIAQIYSMTKPITGVALMTLYEQGAFELDDPIARYVPEFADLKVYAGEDENGEPILEEPKRAPTVRDFTRHTAGLSSGFGGDTPVDERYRQEAPLDRNNSYDEFAEKLGRVPLLYHPGERWLYSDSVDVQALLVERLSGKPFAEYLRDTIFEPLGMKETAFFVPESERDRLMGVYERQEDGSLARLPDDNFLIQNVMQEWTLNPGGWGLASTIDDYTRFARMLLNEGELDGVRILKPETVRLMATDHLPDAVTDTSWLGSKGQVGFGIDFAVRTAPPASAEENFGTVGEFFWDGLASTMFWVDPENELTSVFFVQVIPFDGALHKDFRDAVYGRPAVKKAD